MTLPQRKLTPQEYLDIERKAERKSEFYDGEMFAMAGASEPHESIKSNLAGELHRHFKGRPCKVYTSDIRVKVSPTGLYTYPDVVAICGERKFEDGQRDTLVNPTLISEVLSPSTESYDRGRKFDQYRNLASLTDYVLIAQDRVGVDHFRRQSDGTWVLYAYSRIEETLVIASVAVRISLADIYDGVEFPPNPTLRSVTPAAGSSTPEL